MVRVREKVEEQFGLHYSRFSIQEAIDVASIRAKVLDVDTVEVRAKPKIGHQEGGSYFGTPIVWTFRRCEGGEWKLSKAVGFPFVH